MSFSWLHGDLGIACKSCGNRMPGLLRSEVYDKQERRYARIELEVCQPCRAYLQSMGNHPEWASTPAGVAAIGAAPVLAPSKSLLAQCLNTLGLTSLVRG